MRCTKAVSIGTCLALAWSLPLISSASALTPFEGASGIASRAGSVGSLIEHVAFCQPGQRWTGRFCTYVPFWRPGQRYGSSNLRPRPGRGCADPRYYVGGDGTCYLRF
jgi:hypothetical protein